MHGRNTRQRLLRAHHGRHIQKPEARRVARRAFDAVGIGDAAPEHLIAAAEAEHMAAAAVMREQIDVPALRAQEGEIAAGRLRAGDDDELGIAGDRFARTHHHEIDARLELQRIEIVEIGDPRQREAGDLALARLARVAQAQRVLGRQLAGARRTRAARRSRAMPVFASIRL